jgi:hypothetical protein
MRRLQVFRQRRGRQHRRATRVGHMAQFGIDRVDDLGAKGQHGAGQPDQHEHARP